MSFETFMFIRPWWLIGIPIAIALIAYLRNVSADSEWTKFIPVDKLRYLKFDEQRGTKSNHWWLAVAWTIACVALAGPSFNKIPQPVSKNRDALIVVFDLSPSMLARDLQPDRLTQARLKLIDLLRLREDGETGLIVYGGDAYRIAPLTNDTRTIENLIATLHPNIMPVQGSNLESALTLAGEM